MLTLWLQDVCSAHRAAPHLGLVWDEQQAAGSGEQGQTLLISTHTDLRVVHFSAIAVGS